MLTRPGDELQASPSCLVLPVASQKQPLAPLRHWLVIHLAWMELCGGCPGGGAGERYHTGLQGGFQPAGVVCVASENTQLASSGWAGRQHFRTNPRESLPIECNQSGTLLRFWMKTVSQYSVLSGMWGITTCVITMNLMTVLLAVRTSMYVLFSLSMITVQTALPVPSSVCCSLGCLLQRLHRIMSAVVRQESP